MVFDCYKIFHPPNTHRAVYPFFMLHGVFIYSRKKDWVAKNYIHGDCENEFVNMNLKYKGYKGIRYNITLKGMERIFFLRKQMLDSTCVCVFLWNLQFL